MGVWWLWLWLLLLLLHFLKRGMGFKTKTSFDFPLNDEIGYTAHTHIYIYRNGTYSWLMMVDLRVDLPHIIVMMVMLVMLFVLSMLIG